MAQASHLHILFFLLPAPVIFFRPAMFLSIAPFLFSPGLQSPHALLKDHRLPQPILLPRNPNLLPFPFPSRLQDLPPQRLIRLLLSIRLRFRLLDRLSPFRTPARPHQCASRSRLFPRRSLFQHPGAVLRRRIRPKRREVGDGGGSRVAAGAGVRPPGERRRGEEAIPRRRRGKAWDIEELEGVGDGGGGAEAVGGGGEVAGDDVPEVCVCVLSQLLARVLSLAPGDLVCLLHHVAGGLVLQFGKRDLALAPQVPAASGEMELRISLVLLCSGSLRDGLIESSVRFVCDSFLFRCQLFAFGVVAIWFFVIVVMYSIASGLLCLSEYLKFSTI